MWNWACDPTSGNLVRKQLNDPYKLTFVIPRIRLSPNPEPSPSQSSLTSCCQFEEKTAKRVDLLVDHRIRMVRFMTSCSVYLEGQGALGSRSRRGMTGTLYGLGGLLTYLLSPRDPPSSSVGDYAAQVGSYSSWANKKT